MAGLRPLRRMSAVTRSYLFTERAKDGICLETTWLDRTPEKAKLYLEKPDIQVTNQSDKDEQLNKIGKLDRKVRVCVERENQRQLALRRQSTVDGDGMGGEGTGEASHDTGPSRVLAEALRGGSKPWIYAKMMLVVKEGG